MTTASLNGAELADDVPEALVLRVVRPIVGRRRFVNVEVPGRAGSWFFAEEPGDRILELPVQIQGSGFEDRRDAVRRLAQWADVGAPSRLIVDDEPDRYHDAVLDNDPDPEEWLISAEIPLRFLAGPYALALELSTETLAVTAPSPDSGSFVVPDEIYAEPIIEITPTNGTITGFTFTLNGAALSWSGLILDDETLTISTISSTVTVGVSGDPYLVGAYDPDAVAMADLTGEFPYILPDTNPWSFEWTGTATTVTVEITWRRRFR